MNDLRNNKRQEPPLAFHDTEEVIRHAADYQRDNANDIRVRIPEDTDGFTAYTLFDVTLKNVDIGDSPVYLMECWIDWSPTDPAEWGSKPQRFGLAKHVSDLFQAIRELLHIIIEWFVYGSQGPQEPRDAEQPDKLPMIIRDIDSSNGAEVESILDTNNGNVTLLRATKAPSRTMRFSFKVPNVFFRLPGRRPFNQKRLALNIKVLNGASSSVVHLEYPDSIALRARGDTSEYISLVLSIGDAYMRRAIFFPQRNIRMRYTFGTADHNELWGPGIPPVRTGFALLGFAFAVLLIQAGHHVEHHATRRVDESLFHLAAVVFAISLIPSVTEMLRVDRLFHRSATIVDRQSWERWSTKVFGVIHLLALIIVALTLLKYISLEPYVLGLILGVLGFILIIVSIAYASLLTLGTLQRYMCDRCEKWMWIRRWYEMRIPRRRDPLHPDRQDRLGKWLHRRDLGTRFHPETRHSLCISCYKEVSKEHLVEPPPNEERFEGYVPKSQVTGGTPARISGTGAQLDEEEANAWKDVLGINDDIGVQPLPSFIDSAVRQNLEKMRLQLRYLPSLELNEVSWLDEDKWHTISTQDRIREAVRRYHLEDHIRQLDDLYPGWTNLAQLYWRFVHDRTLVFPRLPGQWMAVETVPKPALGDKYEETEFAKVLGFEADRFHASWNSVAEAIERNKPNILDQLGLAGHQNVNVRLLEALEWNLLGNREGWGETDTYEWTNTQFCRLGYTRFLIVGNSAIGGVGSVSARSPISTADDLGFRAAVVFEESKTINTSRVY